jgi:uncharacterized membrane protein HdeD (DUF308 family)
MAEIRAGGDIRAGRDRARVARRWQGVAARGALAIVVGVLLLTRPGMGSGALYALFGSYLFFDGALALLIGKHADGGRRSLFIEGAVSIAVGILAFVHPSAMKLALVALIAARSIITGLVEIGSAIAYRRRSGDRHGLTWVAGLASLAFGLFLLARPTSGVVVLVWLAGAYAVVFGLGLVSAALRLRGGRIARAIGR